MSKPKSLKKILTECLKYLFACLNEATKNMKMKKYFTALILFINQIFPIDSPPEDFPYHLYATCTSYRCLH